MLGGGDCLASKAAGIEGPDARPAGKASESRWGFRSRSAVVRPRPRRRSGGCGIHWRETFVSATPRVGPEVTYYGSRGQLGHSVNDGRWAIAPPSSTPRP